MLFCGVVDADGGDVGDVGVGDDGGGDVADAVFRDRRSACK